MNYLAHAFLSKHDDGLLIGNFIADHVRNSDFVRFPPEVVNGIMLHRLIDSYTDQSIEFRECKRIFYGHFEKHSGILVDIYFDHLLAEGFPSYAAEPLADFNQKIYATYTRHRKMFPVSAARFLDYVVNHNAYGSYATLDGISRVLDHLSQRIRHNVRLAESTQLFAANREHLKTRFDRFIEDAKNKFGVVKK